MKRRQRTSFVFVTLAVAVIAAAAVISATTMPQSFAFADKGGNGKGNGGGNGGGKSNGGSNGNGGNNNDGGSGNGGANGNGKAGGNGKDGGGGNGNGEAGGKSKEGGNGKADGKGKDGGDGKADGKSKDGGDGVGNGKAGGKRREDGGGSNAESGNRNATGRLDVAPEPNQAPSATTPKQVKTAARDRILRNEVVIANSGAALAAFARSRGFELVRTERLAALGLNVSRLRAPAGLSAAQAKDLIARHFPDAVVDFNHVYEAQASLTLPESDYAAKAVHWSAKLQDCGAAARLGLIDTDVDWALTILKGAHARTARFVEAGTDAAPPQHGTRIATLLVGQNGFGLVPRAELYSAGIFSLDDEGMPAASATSFVAALNWLVANHVTTVNVSLSGPQDRLMELAVQRAQQSGVKLVAAVGNDGMTETPRFPAAYSGVIGVTAIDQSGHVFSRANRGSFVALAAPGVDLLIPEQPDGGGQLVTGTSFAAPYVTAALASYGNDVASMLDSAVDLGAPGPDPVFGRGLVQAPGICPSSASAQ
jgi:hypothetical protein